MKRELIYQLLLLVLIVCFALTIISATQANLKELGVHSGFDFLWKRAGFEIGQSLISYDANSSIAMAFVVALLNTLLLTVVSIICASILGLFIGVARLSSNWLVAHLAMFYIEIFRNIPALLQIFFWYFVVLRTLPSGAESLAFYDMFFLNNRGFYFPAPLSEGSSLYLFVSVVIALGLCIMLFCFLKNRGRREEYKLPVIASYLLLLTGLPLLTQWLLAIEWTIPQAGYFNYQGGYVLMPEFLALVVGLSMYNATYIAEIVRSSVASIDKGQTEAADSLGLPRHLSLRLVILPQALRLMIPPLTTVYLGLFKSTSLAAAIAYPEIISVFVGTVNNLVGQPVIIMTITLTIYVLISLCIAVFLNWYNQRIALTTGNKC